MEWQPFTIEDMYSVSNFINDTLKQRTSIIQLNVNLLQLTT